MLRPVAFMLLGILSVTPIGVDARGHGGSHGGGHSHSHGGGHSYRSHSYRSRSYRSYSYRPHHGYRRSYSYRRHYSSLLSSGYAASSRHVVGGYYTAHSGHQVHRPIMSSAAPPGARAHCGDGSWSFSESRQGTCSHHGGVAEWQ